MQTVRAAVGGRACNPWRDRAEARVAEDPARNALDLIDRDHLELDGHHDVTLADGSIQRVPRYRFRAGTSGEAALRYQSACAQARMRTTASGKRTTRSRRPALRGAKPLGARSRKTRASRNARSARDSDDPDGDAYLELAAAGGTAPPLTAVSARVITASAEDMFPPILPTVRAALYCSVDRSTLTRAAAAGELVPYGRRGKTMTWRRDELDRWLRGADENAARRSPATGDLAAQRRPQRAEATSINSALERIRTIARGGRS